MMEVGGFLCDFECIRTASGPVSRPSGEVLATAAERGRDSRHRLDAVAGSRTPLWWFRASLRPRKTPKRRRTVLRRPPRRRRASSPGEDVVAGFFFEFEAVRTESSDRDAPRRSATPSSSRPTRRSARRRRRKTSRRRCAGSVSNCVEINQCVGCTRQFFTKSFLGDDVAVLARSSGEGPASPRHRAGAASTAWRATR